MTGRAIAATTRTGARSHFSDGKLRVQQLVVVHTPEAAPSSAVTLTGQAVAIGRTPGEGSRIFVPDPEVSRTHATIERSESGRWTIVDCGSRNGTLVNGVRSPRCELEDGAVIRVGRSLLVFVDVELPLDAPLEPEAPGLRGQSLRMQALRGDLALVAPRSVPVLVLGESGSGKERVAQAIHARSGKKGRFVAVNCAAIPDSLAESELFGHAAGAFTGATNKNDGVFVAADEGTLFLDEIGELPASVQPKLLRALANGEVKAVGKAEARTVNVRIIAATHRDVVAAVSAADFRGDLFARLSAWTLNVPPLRQRRDDLLRLARGFLDQKGAAATLSTNAAEALLLFDWPYNVRQLENVVYAAAVRAERAGVIRCEHLPEEIARAVSAREDAIGKRSLMPPPAPPLEAMVPRDAPPTAEQLKLVIERFGGNMARVAEFFGKDRKQVYRWAERFGIDPSAHRDDE